MNIKNAQFVLSAYNKAQIIQDDKPIIALLGKSNVGKSSFINALVNNKNTAKVGNTPGKTRSINFFNIDESFYIVDLPGYGYSKMSKTEKESINNLTDYFLSCIENIKLCVLVLDIRHKPTKDDREMYDWLASSTLPFILVANKSDKIAKTKIDEHVMEIRNGLFAKEEVIAVSSDKKINMDLIRDTLDKYIIL